MLRNTSGKHGKGGPLKDHGIDNITKLLPILWSPYPSFHCYKGPMVTLGLRLRLIYIFFMRGNRCKTSYIFGGREVERLRRQMGILGN
jgi:hypothetical protein